MTIARDDAVTSPDGATLDGPGTRSPARFRSPFPRTRDERIRGRRRGVPARRFLRCVPACLLALALGATGCDRQASRSDSAGPTAQAEPTPISWTHFEVPPPPPLTPELLARGKDVFAQNCASCHGASGAADGPCAQFLTPQPRDFTKSIFRFKTTRGGDLPTDEDLFRTVTLGLHATGMPPWRYLLTDADRWAAVQYIKTLSPAFERGQPGPPVDLGQEPRDIAPERVAHGKQLYDDAGCAACHGAEGYGDGQSADTLQDSFGNPIRPRNFHKAAEFKRGHTLRDVALTISTGNNGTPMPSFGEALESDQLWDLAGYVMSLDEKKLAGGGSPAAASTGDDLGKPDVVINLTERAWRYVPDEIRVRQGQVVRIEFQPTDNGLGAGHGLAIDGYDQVSFINGAMVQRPKALTFVADKAGTFTFYCATQCSTGSLHPNMKGTLVVEPARS
jgi:mono/diheme cytochrome c family protein